MSWSLKTRAALPTNKLCSEGGTDDKGLGGGRGCETAGVKCVQNSGQAKHVRFKMVVRIELQKEGGGGMSESDLCDIVTLLRIWIALPVTPHVPSSTSSLLSLYCRKPFHCSVSVYLQVNPPITTSHLAQAHFDLAMFPLISGWTAHLSDSC